MWVSVCIGGMWLHVVACGWRPALLSSGASRLLQVTHTYLDITCQVRGTLRMMPSLAMVRPFMK